MSTEINSNAGKVNRKAHPWSWQSACAHVRLPLRTVLLFALIIDLVTLGSAWSQPSGDEYHIKAAFLFHFAQLVEWPPSAFAGVGGPLFLCTLEDDAFYDELENTIDGKQIGSRIVRIRHVRWAQVTHGCNLLFISKSESKSLPLAAVRNLPVLTVGEADDFLMSGGMIRFRLTEDKIRFDINLEAADSCHLKISSRLLLLANSVTGRSSIDNGR